MTDPLFNECVEIIHDGAEARRVEKVRKIAECESALANLRVCFDDMNVNCGKCPKCLRTMISLKLLGVLVSSFCNSSLKTIRKMSVKTSFGPIFFNEIIELAQQSQDEELRAALHACKKRHELKEQLLVELDRVLLGKIIKRTYRRLVKDSGEVPQFLRHPL